ncbi:SusC/RagA family TonB-linked outer membrane protein [Niabella beijingensis]|uniref:SusC/RagA family TonB-linked outer membrane protein n=1 Tax=Niabella beijingensis TaxID=2872700 RepID=UPI001CC076D4|nr:SusC/RagA family TonB-linked outer membrane protein [Niabella beijingensis]MBZ4190675.1 SusC/RagA family TonB-linked outer membrane protein [Niabella beijingensis]
MRKIVPLLTMLMAICITGYSQTKTVTGSVVDETGRPIPFATITVIGANLGVAADDEGHFSINVTTGAILEISATGFNTIQKNSAENLKAIMLVKSGKETIEEVIVTASGLTMSKNKVGYGSTVLTSDKLVQASPQNVTSALAGKVPGLQINAVNGGVNPSFSVVLRGYRSITGNNQALIVLDNVIVPNEVVGNLNPNDIENISVLNGASAAALYGSRASNGALIITTKKGSYLKTEVTISQTISAQSVSFYPKLQKQFGSGSTAYIQEYLPYENQQYGPAYDGSNVEIGDFPLPSGKTQTVPYAWNSKEGKLNFWKPALSSQTDLSVSTPTGKGRIYFGAQYLNANGVVENDNFKRTTFSLGGTEKIYPNLSLDYSMRYNQNAYDIVQTGVLAALYDQILNTPGHIPVTRYKNWQVDSFAMPDFYYNAFYNNPYFIKDNNRSRTKNEYLLGNVSLKYSPLSWLDLTGRLGITSRNYNVKNWTNIYRYSQYAKDHTNGSYKKSDITGSVNDAMGNEISLIGDFLATFKKKVSDFDLQLTLAGQLIQEEGKALNAGITGLGVPDLFNISNQIAPPTAGESNFRTRTVGFYADFYGTWKNMLTLHLTGRRDEVSVLDPGYNVFYYPAGDISLLLHKAIPAIASSRVINALKIRAAMSNVGNVNLGPYRTKPTFGQGAGYPYSGNVGYSIGNTIVQEGLKPEFTFSKEAGFDIDLWNSRISASFTIYGQETKNQTMPASVTQSTGFTTYITNTGNTKGSGIETSLSVTPIQKEDFSLTVGANYTYNNNKVVDLGLGDLQLFRMLFFGDGTGVYAATGKAFPALYVTDYLRDSATGKVIVDAVTGYPTLNPNITYAGNTQPLHRLGLNLDADYKGIALRTVFEYRGGYVMYNGLGGTLDFSGAGINTAMYNRERFVFPNSVYKDPATGKYVDNTNITVADGGPNFWTQNDTRRAVTMNYVTSGAFWKLREVSLSYRLPQTILNKTGFIKGVEIAAIGRNLFVWTPKSNVYTDPEFTANANGTGNSIGLNDLGQIPPSRYYGGTLTLKF